MQGSRTSVGRGGTRSHAGAVRRSRTGRLTAVQARRRAAELRQQYQLVFYSDPSAADAWHALSIQSSEGQQLRVPKGYFP